jgi:hypothetical protein
MSRVAVVATSLSACAGCAQIFGIDSAIEVPAPDASNSSNAVPGEAEASPVVPPGEASPEMETSFGVDASSTEGGDENALVVNDDVDGGADVRDGGGAADVSVDSPALFEAAADVDDAPAEPSETAAVVDSGPDVVAVCTPTATRCSGSDVETCGTDGMWGPGVPCAGSICVAGQCAACNPNSTECTSDTQVATCSMTGAWQASTSCTYACVGTVGVVGGNCGGVCVPGTTECSTAPPNGVSTCSTSGQWDTPVACTAAAPTCSNGMCACAAGNSVTNGVCCPSGKTGCSGGCVDEQNDPANCGACGMTCPYGLCQSASCAASFFGVGHPTAGSSRVSVGGGALYGERLASGATSTLVAMGTQTIEGGTHLKLVLYSDNAGVPGNLVAQTGDLTSVANGVTEGGASASVTAGSYYWLMVFAENSIHIAAEAPTVPWYYETFTYGSAPATFSPSGAPFTQNLGDVYFVTAP